MQTDCAVPLKEPPWWYDSPASPMVHILRPVARIYAAKAAARFLRAQAYRSRLPVICVGNFTAGGTGKTPLAIHIAERLLDMGEYPAFLTRGYGGKLRGPHWVDRERDSASETGDEPLLLARAAPTLIARDRRAGAIAIETASADPQGRCPTVIVMDDGLQNPVLIKDFTAAIVDAERGLGNGEVIPAGPLRMEIDDQLPLADAIVVNSRNVTGQGAETIEAKQLQQMRREFPGPVLAAHTEPRGDLGWLSSQPLLAFAGIANPERFFTLLERHGGEVVQRAIFKDHHAFSTLDATRLLDMGTTLQAQLVTTEKDYVRLQDGAAELSALKAATRTVGICSKLIGSDAQRLDALLAAALSSGGYRSGLQQHLK